MKIESSPTWNAVIVNTAVVVCDPEDSTLDLATGTGDFVCYTLLHVQGWKKKVNQT